MHLVDVVRCKTTMRHRIYTYTLKMFDLMMEFIRVQILVMRVDGTEHKHRQS